MGTEDEIGKANDEVEVQLDKEINVELLVEIYKAYLEDTHELRQERVNADNIRVTIVTLFLGAQAYIASTVLTDPAGASLRAITLASCAPIFSAIAAGVVGYIFCNNWKALSKDYSNNLAVKYAELLQLETKRSDLLEPLGANLFTEEKNERAKAKAAAGQGDRGVSRRNVDLQDFFKVVFALVIIGVIVAKILGVAITLEHMNVLVIR
ncbi:MAG: hypothetical protein ACLQUY_15985 [Ktedonobacterales bacterium]